MSNFTRILLTFLLGIGGLVGLVAGFATLSVVLPQFGLLLPVSALVCAAALFSLVAAIGRCWNCGRPLFRTRLGFYAPMVYLPKCLQCGIGVFQRPPPTEA